MVGKQDKHLSTNLRTRFQRQSGLPAPKRVVEKWDLQFLYSFLLKKKKKKKKKNFSNLSQNYFIL